MVEQALAAAVPPESINTLLASCHSKKRVMVLSEAQTLAAAAGGAEAGREKPESTSTGAESGGFAMPAAAAAAAAAEETPRATPATPAAPAKALGTDAAARASGPRKTGEGGGRALGGGRAASKPLAGGGAPAVAGAAGVDDLSEEVRSLLALLVQKYKS